jgi:hypothetical protein
MIERLPQNPLIRADMDDRMGSNIAGPSLIRVPAWVEKPLGRYYLYFADHKGEYIRLAYADSPEGPYTMHAPGSLQLAESHFLTEPPQLSPDRLASMPGAAPVAPHIASPDVHVVSERSEIRMYYHGLLEDGSQLSRVAVSKDGLRFEAQPELIGLPYFRVFRHDEMFYALAMPGFFYRSKDGLTDFEQGPWLFGRDMRHSAVRLARGKLEVYWTRVGDAPESILFSTLDLSGDWSEWKASEPALVMRPTERWEGAGLPVEPSVRGEINERVCQLRDPALFEEDGRSWLLYAGAGENGIGMARMPA